MATKLSGGFKLTCNDVFLALVVGLLLTTSIWADAVATPPLKGVPPQIRRPSPVRKLSPPPKSLPPPKRPAPALPVYPTGQDAIRITGQGRYAESNVCNQRKECGVPARAEVKIIVNGVEKWAPLCNPNVPKALPVFKNDVAKIACNQYYNWPDPNNWQNQDGLYSVNGFAQDPFVIPRKPAAGTGEDLFNSSSYTHWATVTGWGKVPASSVRSVQELSLTVSTRPCSLMMAVFCTVLMV